MIKVILTTNDGCEMFDLSIKDEKGEEIYGTSGNYWDFGGIHGVAEMFKALAKRGLVGFKTGKYECEDPYCDDCGEERHYEDEEDESS